MRTLLVDNHDSFTYNLFHHLAELGGREPTVVENDDPYWRAAHLAAYDAVVLSPGPGHPGRAGDFGICREIVDTARVPLLGVCLGHQGIAVAGGGAVGRAPEPRHGRASPVLHTGRELFAGLPHPFDAVRYHSLAVHTLPAALEATAWTPDGTLMGLRHRHRPLWGVQFHPESIGTPYGRRLLRNFLEQGGTPRRRPASAPAAKRPETSPRRRLTFHTRQLTTRWHEEVVFEDLYGAATHAFWLDSSRTDDDLGRFSFMGDGSGPLARVATADVHSRTVRVTARDGLRLVTGDFLDWLDQDLRSIRVDAPDLPFDFALGWVGSLGYELGTEPGGRPAHQSAEPDATMLFADRAVAFDHHTGTTHLLALAEDGATADATTWLDATTARLTRLAGREPAPAPAAPGRPAPITLRHDRDAYLELIRRCQEQIAAGESYEICLTNMAEAHVALDPWQGYRRLRRISPGAHGSLLRFGDLSVLSSSPERFLRVRADGTAESRPIKGTRPRGSTPAHDRALAEELRADEKERAENLMIVDLVRNDLGRVCETGSVTASEVFTVETHATVHQLVSTVRGTLRADSGAVHCVRAAFPGGSMTGAPKERTMRIIDELEGGARGVYSGAIGYFSLLGTADLSIVIRTAVVTPDRVRYGIGGAITALSDPDAEFEETAVKAAPLLALVGGEFPGRRPALTRAGLTGTP
ncbi:aminodeoxychorismate synthase component I [Streptomyces caniscabiei]|uniref:aminodeoxychorismate synthase component I n=1 Tax=Streptomyces caniscabiei TaxID=2746961 RepID=UPI0029BAEC14|nr:aminodeoxychorismate synthase component I [Streptomyces caniscabiei]MDX2604398.1 aminodeoxychorismate synthase component I [Streptomyces caniscabiei]MDX2735740.1 aminodeoxychorismate synthase component I [Streptomyces caniscabiei]MDX2777989.1 aminodeoxychorismate synthase component I [Streptomyces caniscabiei]